MNAPTDPIRARLDRLIGTANAPWLAFEYAAALRAVLDLCDYNGLPSYGDGERRALRAVRRVIAEHLGATDECGCGAGCEHCVVDGGTWTDA